MWKKWILISSLSFSAQAYRLTQDFTNGFYWQSLPIAITVMDVNAQRKTTLEKLAKSAIGEWEQRTGLSLWDFSPSGTSAVTKNIIRWSDNFAAETQMDPSMVLAVAIRYTSGPYFAKTEIVINGGHQLNNDLGYLLTTITHELGHTMGMDHSDVSAAVMAPTLQQFYSGLHSDDVAGMTAANNENLHREAIGYISPLAYSKEENAVKPFGCGTVAAPAQASGIGQFQGVVSVIGGILMSLLKKFYNWFKSLL